MKRLWRKIRQMLDPSERDISENIQPEDKVDTKITKATNLFENVSSKDDVVATVRRNIVLKESIVSEDAVAKIISALEDDKYTWRTIDGLERATNENRITIEKILDALIEAGMAIKAHGALKNGTFYATWNHYNKKEKSINKFLNSLSGDFRV